MWKKSLSLLAGIVCLASGSPITRILNEDDDRVRTDFVRLRDFDVQIALSGDPSEVNIYSLKDIVTDWLTESFIQKSENDVLISGNETSFTSLGLDFRSSRRDLQESASGIRLFTAKYEGVSLWERRGSSSTPVSPDVVELMLRATFLEDRTLLSLLRSAEPFTGLGTNVVDVRATLFTPAASNPSGNDSTRNDNLQIIIIIAIVVACLAFGLLMFAVVWAWRTDHTKRGDAYSKGDHSVPPRMDVPTRSESVEDQKSPTGMTPPAATAAAVGPFAAKTSKQQQQHQQPPPEDSEPDYDEEASPAPHEYDGSVLSEDISTSLTAYYRSGMAAYSNGARGNNARDFNDAASMSSMDSYGYSLDGYAPSLGPAPQGYPVGGVFNGMVKDPEADYSEDDGRTRGKKICLM